MYEYETIISDNDAEYENRLQQIESLRESITIRENDIQAVMNEDIFDSTKIEGNTLSKREVTYYLENHVTVRGKPMRDYFQIDNYKDALHALKKCVSEEIPILSPDMICSLHYIVTKGELDENEARMFRTEPVSLRTTDYIPPDADLIPGFIDELIDRYNDNKRAGLSDFEAVCEFKRNFERIHPFIDGNGRTGRILMNILFLQNGYGYVSIPAERRDEYFESLEDNTFHKFASELMYDRLLQIHDIHEQGCKEKEKDDGWKR